MYPIHSPMEDGPSRAYDAPCTRHLPISALLAGFLLSACSGDGTPGTVDGAVGDAFVSEALGSSRYQQLSSNLPRNDSPFVEPADATQLAADNLAFGIDLYGQMRAGSTGNIVFSQTSISLALAMLYGGAANNTAAQMATALHFSLPPERLHPAFDALDLALKAQPSNGATSNFQLRIANSTWVQAGFPFLPSYLDLLATSYGTGLLVEDFIAASEAARSDINGWVSDQTEHMIPELFGEHTIDDSTRLVLANAVYFHGTWLQAFNPDSPLGTFHAPQGDVTVPMMSTDEINASLWSGSGWNAAALNYSPGSTSMVLVVPDAGTFATFEQGLTANQLATILAPTQSTLGAVTMPRFGFTSPARLNDLLKTLGMTDAFDPNSADFSAMDGRHDLYVGVVVHEAVISVDEGGTTAAAATGATVVTISLPMQPSETLVVDRPFLFFIRHNPTGAILFQGRVVDPSKK